LNDLIRKIDKTAVAEVLYMYALFTTLRCW